MVPRYRLDRPDAAAVGGGLTREAFAASGGHSASFSGFVQLVKRWPRRPGPFSPWFLRASRDA
jgi:hypothetical protein